MALPDGYLPREGDVLLVRAEVKYDFDPKDGLDRTNKRIHLKCGYSTFTASPSEIDGVYSRHFDEGAEVLFDGDETNTRGVVRAVNGRNLWIEGPDGTMWTYDCMEIKDAPAEADVDPEKHDPPAILPGGDDAPSPADPVDDDWEARHPLDSPARRIMTGGDE